MADFKVKVNNIPLCLDATQKQVLNGLKAIAGQAERYAKEDCPRDTGRLRNSITNTIIGSDAYIGTNVEYAPAVEFRDISHKKGKAHFLRDAASTHGEEYKQIMEAALKS